MAWPWHTVFSLVLIRWDAHAFLITCVESIFNKCQVFLALILYICKSVRFIVDLSLKLLAESVKFSYFIALGWDENFELLSLNINIGALLLSSLFELTALLKHIDEFLKIGRCQFLQSIVKSPSSRLAALFKLVKFSRLLHSVVVLCNDLWSALTPLWWVEVFNEIVWVFFDCAKKMWSKRHRFILRPICKFKLNLIKTTIL